MNMTDDSICAVFRRPSDDDAICIDLTRVVCQILLYNEYSEHLLIPALSLISSRFVFDDGMLHQAEKNLVEQLKNELIPLVTMET